MKDLNAKKVRLKITRDSHTLFFVFIFSQSPNTCRIMSNESVNQLKYNKVKKGGNKVYTV